jgi:mRNA-degrading endonuclease RelE of RelBE toxin-antitoxin system
MDFYVDIKEDARYFLSRQDKNIREKLEKAALSLKYEPTKNNKYLGTLDSGLPFYEKRLFFGGGYRIYYTVLIGRVIIDAIIYEGNVDVNRVGTKKSQPKDIAEMKRH